MADYEAWGDDMADMDRDPDDGVAYWADKLRQAQATIASQRALLKEAEEALRPYVFGDSDIESILWGDLPDDAAMKMTLPLGTHRRARTTLAKLEAHNAD